MNALVHSMFPELLLGATSLLLFLLGCSGKAAVRKLCAGIALAAVVFVFVYQLTRPETLHAISDPWNTVRLFSFGQYVKLLAAGVGVLLILLAWPSNAGATGGSASDFGQEVGEFFGLMLLSLAGVFIVAGANDIILLFLGIELASIPTYVMVSISRPLPVAQEAGVKYFFLGAMSAAILLFGFSYLYGTTGTIRLNEMMAIFASQKAGLTSWQMLGVLMVVAGLAFKIAAVPLHVYAGDVYQGAATPVTAFLAFVPKTSGFVALIKILFAVGGTQWMIPTTLAKLLWAMAVLTMFAGNVLGLLQFNVKRVLAYSSVAHSGYMLVGLTTIAYAEMPAVKENALSGILFYLAAYGIMNAAAFGVLMLLPSRQNQAATSAETFDDLAGQGRNHVLLGLAMAVACFSLTGLPLTVGFLGKFYLVMPALEADLIGLTVLMMINAAIAAAYYLRIVGTMFLRPEPSATPSQSAATASLAKPAFAVVLAIALSIAGTLLFGSVVPAAQLLSTSAKAAVQIDSPQLSSDAAQVSVR